MTTTREEGGTLLKIVLTLLLIGVIALVAGGVYVYRNPLTLHVRQTRGELAAAGLERTEIAHGDGRLVVWQGGAGPDLVFLHGAGDQAGAWSKTAPHLMDRYRVHLLDLPGHGESSPAEGPLKYSTVLAGVEAFLGSLASFHQPPSGGTPILVGHSMGAWLATVYVHRYPAKTSRLVAVNGSPLRADTSVNVMPADREEARRTMAAMRDPSSPKTPDFVLDDIVRWMASGPVGRMMRELDDMESHLLDGRLGEIQTPVDLIWGEADRLLDLDHARRLERELPAARLHVVERCGHLPANECPERFLKLLQQVLAADPPALPQAPEPDPNEGGKSDDPS